MTDSWAERQDEHKSMKSRRAQTPDLCVYTETKKRARKRNNLLNP